jgi:hypothetical protein
VAPGFGFDLELQCAVEAATLLPADAAARAHLASSVIRDGRRRAPAPLPPHRGRPGKGLRAARP